MLKTKFSILLMVVISAQTSHAGNIDYSMVKWTCPSSIEIRNTRYPLINAGVFDGPPEELAQLVPIPGRFPQHILLNKENIYLVCGYAGYPNKIIVHAKGASYCGYDDTPFHAGCWEAP
jgi:hypothetical protein